MKKQYVILLSIIAIEFTIVSILNQGKITIQSWIGNAIGALIFLQPVQILLYLLAKDEAISPKKQMCAKFAFVFISICYILGGIATLM